jgi:uncharacterized membrane protein SirB2
VPAAAVIPAPIAYIKVAAVKKLVVRFLVQTAGQRQVVSGMSEPLPYVESHLIVWHSVWLFTLRKLECFKQASALNTLAWNNKI